MMPCVSTAAKKTIITNVSSARSPFLNGGLFDPMGNYDWEKTTINLSNKLFSHKTKDDPEGDGILDVFDLYNFTVKEDEPLKRKLRLIPNCSARRMKSSTPSALIITMSS